MASTNLKHNQLPINYSEEDGWTLNKEDLNDHLKAHFDELRQAAMASKDISNKKMTIVVLLIVSLTIIISAMALAGSPLFALILGIIAVADISPILQFMEKK